MTEETGHTAYSRVPALVRELFDEIRGAHHKSLEHAIIDVLFAAGEIRERGEKVAMKVTLAPPVVTAREDVHAWVLIAPKWFDMNDPRQKDSARGDANRLMCARAFDSLLCGLTWDDEHERLKKQPGCVMHKAILMRYGPLPGSIEKEIADVVLDRYAASLRPWEPLPNEPAPMEGADEPATTVTIEAQGKVVTLGQPLPLDADRETISGGEIDYDTTEAPPEAAGEPQGAPEEEGGPDPFKEAADAQEAAQPPREVPGSVVEQAIFKLTGTMTPAEDVFAVLGRNLRGQAAIDALQGEIVNCQGCGIWLDPDALDAEGRCEKCAP